MWKLPRVVWGGGGHIQETVLEFVGMRGEMKRVQACSNQDPGGKIGPQW